MLLLTCAPAAAAVPRIPFAHVPLSSSPLQPTAAAAAMTLLLFLPPSDEESTLASGRPAARALLTSSPSSRVGMDRKSPHGATEEWESRDRAPAAVGHETAPGVAVSGVQAAMTGCWRRGGFTRAQSRQMALNAPARRSRAARRRRTAWTLFNGILRSKTQSWGQNLNAAMPAMEPPCANCPNLNPSSPPWR